MIQRMLLFIATFLFPHLKLEIVLQNIILRTFLFCCLLFHYRHKSEHVVNIWIDIKNPKQNKFEFINIADIVWGHNTDQCLFHLRMLLIIMMKTISETFEFLWINVSIQIADTFITFIHVYSLCVCLINTKTEYHFKREVSD